MKDSTRKRNLQRIARQLASLVENPDLPHGVEEGIKDYLCELGSVVPLWNPRILRAVYPILVEEAAKEGVDITQPNLVGQNIEWDKTQQTN